MTRCTYELPDPMDEADPHCAADAEYLVDPDNSRMYLCGYHLLEVMDQPGERYLVEVLP